jgi:hypothetical protein
MLSITQFKPYYFNKSTPSGFELDQSSVNFQANVLVFKMNHKSGKVLAFTEQAWPEDYDISTLKADKELTTPYGKAFISDTPSRTTATLFTNDRTWIMINAPTPIGVDSMTTVVSQLEPISGD